MGLDIFFATGHRILLWPVQPALGQPFVVRAEAPAEAIYFDGNTILGEEARIRAELLQYLVEYIPHSIQRKMILEAIRLRELIPVENAALRITKKDDATLRNDIKIYSSDVNLDVDLTVDIVIEGGLNQILKHFHKIAK